MIRAPLLLTIAVSLAAVPAVAQRDTAPARAAVAPADSARAAAPRRRNPDFLDQQEIRGAHATSLLLVVQRLRPRWLVSRAVAGGAPMAAPGTQDERAYNVDEIETVVYVDRQRAGGRAVLREMNPITVDSMRFVPGPAATARWGALHREGAILVYTRR